MIRTYSLPRHFKPGCTNPRLPLATKSRGSTTIPSPPRPEISSHQRVPASMLSGSVVSTVVYDVARSSLGELEGLLPSRILVQEVAEVRGGWMGARDGWQHLLPVGISARLSRDFRLLTGDLRRLRTRERPRGLSPRARRHPANGCAQ